MFHLRVAPNRNVVNLNLTPSRHLWRTNVCVPPSIPPSVPAGSAWHSKQSETYNQPLLVRGCRRGTLVDSSRSSVLANTKAVALRGERTLVCLRHPFRLVCKCHRRCSSPQWMLERAQELHAVIRQRDRGANHTLGSISVYSASWVSSSHHLCFSFTCWWSRHGMTDPCDL